MRAPRHLRDRESKTRELEETDVCEFLIVFHDNRISATNYCGQQGRSDRSRLCIL
jgi:hypothetical protein